MPAYKRPFLVIGKEDGYLNLLNVSSVHNKERKLLFPSNKLIDPDYHYPPFPKSSFVKLDIIYRLKDREQLEGFLMDNGGKLHNKAFNDIIEAYTDYKDSEYFQVEDIEINQYNPIQ